MLLLLGRRKNSTSGSGRGRTPSRGRTAASREGGCQCCSYWDSGRTALQAAAEGGHLAVVERLLQEKADVNAAPARYREEQHFRQRQRADT